MSDTTMPSGRTSFDDVASGDGTAMTILLTERCGPGNARNNQPLHQTWWDRRNVPATADFNQNPANYTRLDNTPIPGIGIFGAPPAKIINNITNNRPGFWSQPSSNHAGGVVAAFCDGHTGFIKDSVPAAVYGNLLNWNNAAVTGNPGRQWVPADHILSESQYQ